MRMPRGDLSKLLDDTNHAALGVELWVMFFRKAKRKDRRSGIFKVYMIIVSGTKTVLKNA